MNDNKRAVRAFDRGDIEEALRLFQVAVNKNRTIQSLHNLAWFYGYEEEEYEKALALSLEAVMLRPTSYFPYNLLGELYMKLARYDEAIPVLEDSLQLHSSKEATFNLAVSYYEVGKLEQATNYFQKAAGNSDYTFYLYVKCLIEGGRVSEAREKLALISEDASDFVGEGVVAALYLELGDYEQAVNWYNKSWDECAAGADYVARFAYALYQFNDTVRLDEIIETAVNEVEKQLEVTKNMELGEGYSEIDRTEELRENENELAFLRELRSKLEYGFVPDFTIDLYVEGRCYLFGCTQHEHPEYGAVKGDD
ncbi:tetratricopeptide repeat protein [Bacillus sp. FJAT-45037]|uniref:tetratricopeptide repeat protein n=1 Tax=Bacillus sp. FJAT-45037 TaxID=2011007 RepID=UPI000C243E47|nr:tetratricopeptide repeat protein [Bacillus sp. FJAT-45037]